MALLLVLQCILCMEKNFFDFTGFEPRASCDVDSNLLTRFLKNLGHNMKATARYFLVGGLLSQLFQRYLAFVMAFPLAAGLAANIAV